MSLIPAVVIDSALYFGGLSLVACLILAGALGLLVRLRGERKVDLDEEDIDL